MTDTPIPAQPPVLLIDRREEASDGLEQILVASGLRPVRITDPSEAAERLRGTDIALVGLVDDGQDLREFLARLRPLKASCPHLLTLLFSDRTDDVFLDECVTEFLIDHILPLSGHPPESSPNLLALARLTRTIGELAGSNRSLRDSAATDEVTGLPNRRRSLEWLRHEHRRATRNLETLSCLMVDLDHFRLINETYGPEFGDVVLQETAGLLCERVRVSDTVGRHGSDEFVILAPKTGVGGAQQLAEKLRRAIEKHVFRDGVFEVRMTASFGLATSDHSAVSSPEMLLQLTERALLEAKYAGRNRVMMARSRGVGQVGILPSEFQLAGPDPAPSANILVVQNSPVMAEMLSSIVRSMGMNAIEARDGPEALEIISVTLPGCVLLDANMPGIDGHQICRRIKSHHHHVHIPVVIMGPDSGIESQLRAHRCGADDHIVTPVVREHLMAKIQAQLRIRSLHDRLRDANAKLRQAQGTLLRAERLRAIGELAGGVAHEFNNLLGSILGRTQHLETLTEPSDILRGLQTIEQLAESGRLIARRLQTFSRAAPLAQESTPVRVDAVLEECLGMTRARWKNEADLRGIHCDIERDIESDLIVEGVPSEITEVFTNLILNALDAMPHGGTLKVRATPGGGDTVTVEVTDTGVGIPAEIRGQIFDPFFTTKMESGTGLGLSVVQDIVCRMGGSIEVTSEVGGGTRFLVTLPARATPPAPEPSPDDSMAGPGEEEAAQATQRASILVIDDEPHIRDIFTEFLSDQGFSVTARSDGESGLTEFHRDPPDIVVTDLGMPGVSGWEVVRQIKGSRPQTKIILTTGWGVEADDQDPNQRRADAILAKPVSLQALLDCVETLLEDEDNAPPVST